MTRDGTHLLTIKQALEGNNATWSLNIYSFRLEKEPFTYHSLVNLKQLNKPLKSLLLR